MYEYTHKTYHTTSIIQKGHSFPGLPRVIRNATPVTLEACENCFKEIYTKQEVFTLEAEPILTDEIKMGTHIPQVVTPTPLSDF
jgi:hypothetical protein